jgi:hypothetical protein
MGHMETYGNIWGMYLGILENGSIWKDGKDGNMKK